MDALHRILQDIAEQWDNEENIINEYTYMYGRSPEDIVCEKETRAEVSKLIPLAAEFLDYEDRRILIRYIVDGLSMQSIADELKISQQAVSDRLKKIPHKLRKYYARFADIIPCFNPSYGGVVAENFTDTPISSYHPIPKHPFLFDYYVSWGVGGYWGQYKGKPMYRTKKICKLKEYIGDSVACSLCKTCKGELNGTV